MRAPAPGNGQTVRPRITARRCERHIFGSGASMHVRQSIEAAACYACASELSFADARSTSRCGYLAVQLDRVGHDDDTS
jgi:hypothetical protein